MTINEIIKQSVSIGVIEGMSRAGEVNPEITARKASKVYGKWFRDAAASGRLQPSRVSAGNHQYYRVTDILTLQLADSMRAELR